MQSYAKSQLADQKVVRFIDPAIGTGSFYSAFLQVFPQSRISSASGYEIDPDFGIPATKLWSETGLKINLKDFTKAEAPTTGEKFNLLICNPPYVRHHHIDADEKRRLKQSVSTNCGVEINGLAGLYCYFMVMSHLWMADDGLAGWLVPSEFMDVNYGYSLKQYLLEKVTLLHIHRFDPSDLQFDGALVSTAVVWFRNSLPRKGHKVRFTYGGTLNQPSLERLVPAETLYRDPKWTHYPMKFTYKPNSGAVLGDFFQVKRGLTTGNNQFFILSAQEIEQRGLPIEAFKAILPSPRYIHDNEIKCDQAGNPELDRCLFLLDPPWTEDEIKENHPRLWNYLEEGKAAGIAERYTCRHRTRWYAQENRPPAPFVCTYLGRSNKQNDKPFRFLLNNSKATATNVYLMLYPKAPMEQALMESANLKRQVWESLNQISPQVMLGEGRVYGGGLHKLEPWELANVPADKIDEILPQLAHSKQ